MRLLTVLNNQKKGFTLIELLTVIVVIGILATLTFLSYSSADKQVRDAQRKNDIEQYRNLLQQYAVANGGKYPGTGDVSVVIGSGNLCDSSNLNMNPCLADPLANSNPYGDGVSQSKLLNYQYVGAALGTNYILYARLESAQDKYWEACSSGKAGVVSTTNGAIIPPTDSTVCSL